ncbi:hypothetical protein [Swingsia samuiensis]|uniref:Uncharacterized protein n=1 Tax=Swingsia samuiensis TaxID=1293412 RepID=A0A4Y6UIA2_9PROT|nr:hypothetical protein [Swingsia samuiensis]QDH17329.1 hypothetical protein E3D00_06975 [Swingsia samuiensis]
MKRSVLTFSLIAVIAGISAVGIHHAASVSVQHGLARFRESLPPGTTLTYSSAEPAIFARGVTLKDVVLQRGPQTFRACQVLLGHPTTTPDGKLSLSVLDITSGSLQTPKALLNVNSLHANHLITPLNFDLKHTPLNQLPEQISLGHGDVDHLSIKSADDKSSIGAALKISQIHIDDYANDKTVSFLLNDIQAIADIPSPKNIPVQSDKPTTLAEFNIQTLKFSQANLPLALSHALTPNMLYWSDIYPASLSLQKVSFSEERMSFAIDQITSNASKTGVDTLSTVSSNTGIHFHLTNKKLPIQLDGAHSSIQTTATKDIHTGSYNIQYNVTIPNYSNASVSIKLLTPTINQELKNTSNDSDKNQFLKLEAMLHAIKLSEISVSIHGDRMVNSLIPMLARISGNTLPSDPKAQALVRDAIIKQLTASLSDVPALSPVPDFLSSPQNRTISFNLSTATPIIVSDLFKSSSDTEALIEKSLKVTVQ